MVSLWSEKGWLGKDFKNEEYEKYMKLCESIKEKLRSDPELGFVIPYIVKFI